MSESKTEKLCKLCKPCNTIKSIDEFYSNNNQSKDGKSYYCKECNKLLRRKYYQKRKVTKVYKKKNAENFKHWRNKNAENLKKHQELNKECGRIKGNFYLRLPKRIKELERDLKLWEDGKENKFISYSCHQQRKRIKFYDRLPQKIKELKKELKAYATRTREINSGKRLS